MSNTSQLEFFFSPQSDQELTSFMVDQLSDRSRQLVVLLSGGSLVSVYQQLANQLADQRDLSHVSLSQVDERAVAISDPDSNQHQIALSGLPQLITNRGGKWLPLSDPQDSANCAKTAEKNFLNWQRKGVKIMVLLGIGEDGHTAGVLPLESESDFSSLFCASHHYIDYRLPAGHLNPHPHRITLTLTALSESDLCIAYATEKKQRVLIDLLHYSSPIHQMPAQILHQVPSRLYSNAQIEIERTSAP